MIDKYIKYLLLSNTTVIIPGFGAFVLKVADEGEVLTFNELIKFNDGLLIDTLVSEENIDEATAVEYLNTFVHEVSQALNDKKFYDLGELGVLTLSENNAISFISSRQASGSIDAETNTEEFTTRIPLSFNQEDLIAPRRKKFLWIGAVALLLVLILVFVLWHKGQALADIKQKHHDLIEGKANEAVISVVSDMGIASSNDEARFVEDSVMVDSVRTAIAEYAMEPGSSKSMDGVFVAVSSLVAPEGEERYNVIVASFKNSDNASVFFKLINTGAGARLIERENGFVAVAIDSFTTLDEALIMCGQSLSDMPDAWILVK